MTLRPIQLFSALAGVITAASLGYHQLAATPAPRAPGVAYVRPTATPDPLRPTRLMIPALNVNATIEELGLTSAGAMDTPKGPSDVAWYKPGTRPGEIGSAVMAGHSGWTNRAPAVFDRLTTLKKGAKIMVIDGTGSTITFAVREIKDYRPADDTTNVFTSNDQKAHLNLITCEGVWKKATQSYTKRRVVFADQL